MHELAVTQSVLDIALRHARKAGAGRITDLYLVIGQLSSIVDDSVAFYWDIISRDTIAEGARLHFQRVPAEMVCLECSREYTLDGDALPCPNCGSTRVKVTAGEDFRLEAIEVEPIKPELSGVGG
jgi:hydrogenase nickel incorporation protein HypA/HybF